MKILSEESGVWFKSKNVQLSLMGQSFGLSWEELGTFMAELALQNALSDIEYIEKTLSNTSDNIFNNASPIITLSVSFHLSMLEHGLLFCKGIDKHPYFLEIQKGINIGLLNLGNESQKLFAKEHSNFVYQFMGDYKKQYNRLGFNRNEFEKIPLNHSVGYFHSQNIFSFYNIDSVENVVYKQMLAKYFDSIYLKLLEDYYAFGSLGCYKCGQGFKSTLNLRNPFAKRCKNCDYELK